MSKICCDKADFTKFCGIAYKVYALFLKQVCLALKVELSLWNFQKENYPFIEKFTIEDFSPGYTFPEPSLCVKTQAVARHWQLPADSESRF
jgi:hypothetical protein